VTVDGPEQRPVSNSRPFNPGLEHARRARLGIGTVGNADLATDAHLIGLRSAQGDG